MRHWVIGFLAAIGLAGGLSGASQGNNSPVGMLIQAEGQVIIQRGTQKAAARVADLLYQGDTIVTASGKAVIMYCPSSERLTFSAGCVVELGSDGIKVLKGQASRSPAKCLLPHVALGAESLERVGTFRARGYPPLTQYLGGPITSGRPLFLWGSVEGAAEYQVVVKDPERDTVVWQTRTPALMITYPESLEPLKKAEYEWQVQAQSGDKVLAEGRASFEVRPDAGLSGSGGAGEDAGLLRAIELENAGYYSEAATFFRKLREASPGDVRLIRHLAWLYWNAGLIEAFNEEWKRLSAGQRPQR